MGLQLPGSGFDSVRDAGNLIIAEYADGTPRSSKNFAKFGSPLPSAGEETGVRGRVPSSILFWECSESLILKWI